MAFAIWSPTFSKSLSAVGAGAEEMAGGEIAAGRRLESSVTVSSVFRSAREVTISAHNQTAVITSAQPPIIFSSIARSRAFMKRGSATTVPASQSPGNFAQAYLLTAIARQGARTVDCGVSVSRPDRQSKLPRFTRGNFRSRGGALIE